MKHLKGWSFRDLDVIGSINGIRNSTQKLRGCIVQSELPSFLR
jgi:hypothetical protein